MRTSAPHLHDMRISQHLRSLSYYSDDAEQVPEMKEPEQETSSGIKQDTVQQPRATDGLAPKISLVRDESTKDKSSHSITVVSCSFPAHGFNSTWANSFQLETILSCMMGRLIS